MAICMNKFIVNSLLEADYLYTETSLYNITTMVLSTQK